MNKENYLFFLILIVFTFFPIMIIVIKEKPFASTPILYPYQSENISSQNEKINADNLMKEITDEYELTIINQMRQFYKLEVIKENSNAIEDIRDKIFALKVPARYKPLHLDLVIGFDLMLQGLKEDDTLQTQKGKQKIDNAVKANDWIIKK